MRLEDWLSSLERARNWNDWTEAELMMQFASHLCGRACQEWSLLSSSEKLLYKEAVKALKLRLDPGSCTLAAQEFRHTSQGDNKKVADFIRRLERTFNAAYGREGMSTETRDTLLHGQLQDALKHELMQAPSVSGAQTYPELSLAARNKEKRQAELKKRQQYLKLAASPQAWKITEANSGSKSTETTPAKGNNASKPPLVCFFCHEPGHIARNCKKKASKRGQGGSQTSSKQVTTIAEDGEEARFQSLREQLYMLDESSGDDVCLVKVMDNGSRLQCVKLQVQSVPAYGIIDSGAGITIMGGILFKKVATVARLWKRDLKKADKTPRNYNHTPFSLDSRIEMDLTFDDKTMRTSVYIKTDAHDQLLLSEGVCRQLGIVQNHPAVESWRGGRKKKRSRSHSDQSQAAAPSGGGESTTVTEAVPHSRDGSDTGVPTVRVRLVQSLRLLPHQGATVTVEVDGGDHLEELKTVLLRPSDGDDLLQVQDSLLQVGKDHSSCVQVFNPSDISCCLEAGSHSGRLRRLKSSRWNILQQQR